MSIASPDFELIIGSAQHRILHWIYIQNVLRQYLCKYSIVFWYSKTCIRIRSGRTEGTISSRWSYKTHVKHCRCHMTNDSLFSNPPGVQRYGPACNREMVPWEAWCRTGRAADSREVTVRVLRGDRSSWWLLPGPRERDLCGRLHAVILVWCIWLCIQSMCKISTDFTEIQQHLFSSNELYRKIDKINVNDRKWTLNAVHCISMYVWILIINII